MDSSRLTRIGRCFGWLGLSSAVLFGTSCGTKQPAVFEVRGQVLYEGKPVANAFVVLHPLGESGGGAVRPTASTDNEGWFVVSSFHAEDGAPAGDYAVTVEWRKPKILDENASVQGPNLLPAKYSKPATSDLRIRVEPGINQDQFLRLKR